MALSAANLDRQLQQQLEIPHIKSLLGINAVEAIKSRMGSGAGGGPAVSPLSQSQKRELSTALNTYNSTYSLLSREQRTQTKKHIEETFARPPPEEESDSDEEELAAAYAGDSNSDENAEMRAALALSRASAAAGPMVREPVLLATVEEEETIRQFIQGALGIGTEAPLVRFLNPETVKSNSDQIDIRCYVAALYDVFKDEPAATKAELNAQIAAAHIAPALLSWEKLEEYNAIVKNKFFFAMIDESVESPLREQGKQTDRFYFPFEGSPLAAATIAYKSAKLESTKAKAAATAPGAPAAAASTFDSKRAEELGALQAFLAQEQASFGEFQGLYGMAERSEVIPFRSIQQVAETVLPCLPVKFIKKKNGELTRVARERNDLNQLDLVPGVCGFRGSRYPAVMARIVESCRTLGRFEEPTEIDKLIEFIKNLNVFPLRKIEIPPEGLGAPARAPVNVSGGMPSLAGPGLHAAELAVECSGMTTVPTIGDGSCLVHALLTLVSPQYRCATPTLRFHIETSDGPSPKLKYYTFTGERDFLGKLFRKIFFTEVAFSTVQARPETTEANRVLNRLVIAYERAFLDDTNLYLEELDVGTFVNKFHLPLVIFRNSIVTQSTYELTPGELRPRYIGAIANAGLHYEAVRWDGEFLIPYPLFLAKQMPIVQWDFEYNFLVQRFRYIMQRYPQFQNSAPGEAQSATRQFYERFRAATDSLRDTSSVAEMTARIPGILDTTLAEPPLLPEDQRAPARAAILQAWAAASETPFPVEQNVFSRLFVNAAFESPGKQRTLTLLHNLLQKSPVFAVYKNSKVNPATALREVPAHTAVGDVLAKVAAGGLVEVFTGLGALLDSSGLPSLSEEEAALITAHFTPEILMAGVLPAPAEAGGARRRRPRTRAQKSKKSPFAQTRKRRRGAR